MIKIGQRMFIQSQTTTKAPAVIVF